MGTKFGNIHVRTNDKDAVIAALREMSAENGGNGLNERMFEGFETILARANQSENIYFVGELQPGWISILNDCFEWGQTEAFGEQLSSYLNGQVLTISYFDDDVFEMNVYAGGKWLTGQIWCTGGMQQEYGLEDKQADISILTEMFGHRHIGMLNDILSMDDDCEQAVEALQELMQLPLWIKSDWFDDMSEEDKAFMQQYEKCDFNH